MTVRSWCRIKADPSRYCKFIVINCLAEFKFMTDISDLYSRDFDFPEWNNNPQSIYIVATSPRCGKYLLIIPFV